MFDFFFYRLYVFYEKKERNGDSVWTAALYLTLLQFLMLYSIVVKLYVESFFKHYPTISLWISFHSMGDNNKTIIITAIIHILNHVFPGHFLYLLMIVSSL